jgi:hypothetical protein
VGHSAWNQAEGVAGDRIRQEASVAEEMQEGLHAHSPVESLRELVKDLDKTLISHKGGMLFAASSSEKL